VAPAAAAPSGVTLEAVPAAASPASLAAFVAILLAVIGMLVAAVHRAYAPDPARPTALFAAGLAAWLGGFGLLVASGRLTTLPLGGLPLVIVPTLLIWTVLAASPVGRRIAAAVPLAALVGFQAFRLPLELVLHSWAAQGVVPGVMTWTGRNWDIASGVVALLCAPIATRWRPAAWIANAVGSLLLLNVMRVAVFAAPVPFGWGVEPPLLLAYHLPYAWIVPVCVGGALFGHLVLTRALVRSGGVAPDAT